MFYTIIIVKEVSNCVLYLSQCMTLGSDSVSNIQEKGNSNYIL